jgi:hypothetical protein
VVAKSAPGKFVQVGSANVETGVPGVLETSGHQGFVAWPTNSGGAAKILVATVSSSGSVSAAKTALSGWGSIGGQITLLPGTQQPQVIFSGVGPAPDDRGCVYAATGTALPWSLENGSLSNDCVNPEPAGAEGGLGELGAAWAGAGLKYHVGLDPNVPATSADGTIAAPATVDGSGMTFSPADRAFWVAWGQTNGGSTDGYFVRNVDPSTTALKMPGTGTQSIEAVSNPGDLPFTATPRGAFLAACSNTVANCHLMLWRFGASKAMTVPKAVGPNNAAVAQGPSGRIWVAWGVRSNNTVMVTRSNKKDTRFGAVHTYRTACVTGPVVAISGPATGAAVLALECGSGKIVKPTVFATHVLPGLSEHLSTHKLTNTSTHMLKVKVTDAGDAVSHAKVTFRGSTKRTNAHGVVSFAVPQHLATGKYGVVAKHAGYLPAHGTVKVT